MMTMPRIAIRIVSGRLTASLVSDMSVPRRRRGLPAAWLTLALAAGRRSVHDADGCSIAQARLPHDHHLFTDGQTAENLSRFGVGEADLHRTLNCLAVVADE